MLINRYCFFFVFFFLLLTPLSYAENFRLVGEGMLQYSFFRFNIYYGKLYTRKDVDVNKNDLIKGKVDSYLELEYARDISSGDSQKGWEKGVEAHLSGEKLKSYEEALQWLIDKTPNFKKGDRFKIMITNEKLNLYVNDELRASSEDRKVLDIVYLSWLGPEAVDKKFREQLLEKL